MGARDNLINNPDVSYIPDLKDILTENKLVLDESQFSCIENCPIDNISLNDYADFKQALGEQRGNCLALLSHLKFAPVEENDPIYLELSEDGILDAQDGRRRCCLLKKAYEKGINPRTEGFVYLVPRGEFVPQQGCTYIYV